MDRLISLQAAAVERDVQSKAKTVRQMVSELEQKKVSLYVQYTGNSSAIRHPHSMLLGPDIWTELVSFLCLPHHPCLGCIVSVALLSCPSKIPT